MKKFEAESVLPRRPFLTGMTTALDIYGASGLRMYERIHRHWLTVISRPRPSAEESITESVATVNGEYQRLLAEHLD